MRWWEISLLSLATAIIVAAFSSLFLFLFCRNWEVTLWGAIGSAVGCFLFGLVALSISALASKRKRK